MRRSTNFPKKVKTPDEEQNTQHVLEDVKDYLSLKKVLSEKLNRVYVVFICNNRDLVIRSAILSTCSFLSSLVL